MSVWMLLLRRYVFCEGMQLAGGHGSEQNYQSVIKGGPQVGALGDVQSSEVLSKEDGLAGEWGLPGPCHPAMLRPPTLRNTAGSYVSIRLLRWCSASKAGRLRACWLPRPGSSTAGTQWVHAMRSRVHLGGR